MVGIELELAIELICDSVKSINDIEEVSIEKARGRIIGEDIIAPINQPPFDRSPLDGYALRSEDITGASKKNPIKLKVIDEVCAGGYTHKEVGKNETIRIMTGAKIPKGCDCVIRQESTDYGMETVEIYQEVKHHQNYCFEGEDITKGSKLINLGEKLSYIHIGIIASMGYEKVKVIRRPKVALISTGDEVICGGKPLTEGKIYDSNRRMIASRLEELGCEVVVAEVMGDDENLIANEIKEIIKNVDVVFTTGGVSVGKKDIMHQVIKILDTKRVFWRVNMKPGTPAIYALYENKPLLCLSGNPFAAIATFELMGKQLLYKLGQDPDLKEVRKEAVLQDEFLKESRVRRLIRATYDEGKVYLPKGGHSSGMLGSMIGCNCLIDIKPGTPKLDKGEKVQVVLL